MVQHASGPEGERLTTEAIAAIATPPGRGGVGIVRVSGAELAERLGVTVRGSLVPRQAKLTDFIDADGEPIDQGICLYFPAPRSFTGEDVIEYHGHGGPRVLELLLDRLYELGVRAARPGEFTERAYLNDKMDLAQAEAVLDLINAGSKRAARAALRSLVGVFSDRVQRIEERLRTLRVFVEASLDFSDEEIDFLSGSDVEERVGSVGDLVADLIDEARHGEVLTRGLDVVIAGPPNVGKSTLMNVLSQTDRAIVTDIPGTTRDLLHVEIEIDGVPVRLTDTAGIRSTDDPVERLGVERAQAAVGGADVVLEVRDASAESESADMQAPEALVVWNKVDLVDGFDPPVGVAISATTGIGLDALRTKIVESVGLSGETGTFSARLRHLQSLEQCREALDRARRALASAPDVAAEELRGAHRALGEIVGETTADDLLGEIFSQFCIGK